MKPEELRRYDEARNLPIEVGCQVYFARANARGTVLAFVTGTCAEMQPAVVVEFPGGDVLNIHISDLIRLP